MLATMIFLAGAAAPDMAPPDSADTYEERRLDGHVSGSSARVIDGLPYFDSGVLEGGLAFSAPSGLTAGFNLALGEGNGSLLPEETVGVLESHVGWGQAFEEAYWHFSIFDYRLDASPPGADASQGARLTAGSGRLSAALSFEDNMPMYLARFGRFIPYHNRRFELQWTDQWSRELGWSAGIGYRDVDRIDVGYSYATLSLDGHWQSLQWQLALFVADHEAESLYYGVESDTESLLLRVTLPFRVF